MSAGIPFGDYQLVRRLGTGGMAEVFLARRVGPGGFAKQLVIKRILPHLSASERFTSMFLNEARLAAIVDHPNLVHVSNFGEIDGQYFLAMEYVDGITVADFMTRVGLVGPGVACRIAIDLLEALHAIHSATDERGTPLGLVHRDVSPRNVMIRRDGALKLLDFGIAISKSGPESLTMGTRRYMSPEQMLGATLDARSDLYCVGVLLFHMLTGAPPFEDRPDRVPERPAEVPEPLWPSLRSALELAPEKRPASARELQSALELFLATRGLEGTRAHLAHVATQIASMPGDATPSGLLTHLTRITRFTRGTRSGDVGLESPLRILKAAVFDGSRARRAALFGGLVIVASTLVYRAQSSRQAGREEIRVEPLAIDSPLPPPPGTAAQKTGPLTARTATASPAVSSPSSTETQDRRPGREARRERPRPRLGKLNLDTRPWTVVYLEGKKLGMTPISGVKLRSGEHVLTLKNEELGLVKELRVVIHPGRVTRVQKSL